LNFDPQKDFVPVALLESSPIVLVASASIHVASGSDLIRFIRANPDALSYASNGNGSPEQVAGEVFKQRLNLRIRHLPFEGAGPARKAVLAGQASLMFDPCKGALPSIRQGLLRPLAVAAPSRLSELPDVPTFGEIGVPQYELRVWTGVLAPVGTPREIAAKLSRAIAVILRTPAIRRAIADEGGAVGVATPEGFAAYMRAERKRWSKLVVESGIAKVQTPPVGYAPLAMRHERPIHNNTGDTYEMGTPVRD
jgi:tripartite-type tricarboxylate transporter receptor subunit TctC